MLYDAAVQQCCCTHIRRFQWQTQQSVHQKGEDSCEAGDDAGDAGVCILDVTDQLKLFLFFFP